MKFRWSGFDCRLRWLRELIQSIKKIIKIVCEFLSRSSFKFFLSNKFLSSFLLPKQTYIELVMLSFYKKVFQAAWALCHNCLAIARSAIIKTVPDLDKFMHRWALSGGEKYDRSKLVLFKWAIFIKHVAVRQSHWYSRAIATYQGSVEMQISSTAHTSTLINDGRLL